MNFFKMTLWSLLVLTAFSFSACKDGDDPIDTDTSVVIELDHVAGGKALNFTDSYTLPSGETAKFTKIKYYLSNFQLLKADGSSYTIPKDESYFLVDLSDPSSQTITLKNVPVGEYSAVKFILGVDSLKSVQPVSERKGVLDEAGPGGDMYWNWNSGYIFIKMEGQVGSQAFQYHVGGFGGYDAPTVNNIKGIKLTAPADPARVKAGHDAPEFHVEVNVLEFFQNPTVVKVTETPFSHFTPLGITLADNYKDMFVIDHVHNH